ncbi:PIG-L deacetylase family protein [Rhodoferax bucti]|uniref:PIG-L deacetylase family protein n=1 Tax=Rhodoferax bucti TaxID=2576305 RepID=UPI00197D9619|nr:PIG-L family deacetylase [Rhodoferax bucti]
MLVVAAHTDDEALGCGGTIARHVGEGDTVYAVFMADGVTSRVGADQEDLLGRNAAAENARAILGIEENFYLGLPDNRMDSIPLIDVVQKLEPIIDRIKPNIVYTHHHGDLNVDHRITHQAVMIACRPVPGCSVRMIYAFEVMSSTEWSAPIAEPFIPNHYVDISNQLNTKLYALKAYQLEMRESPHTRSIEHIECLAHHRGYSMGMLAAESFVTLRTTR